MTDEPKLNMESELVEVISNSAADCEPQGPLAGKVDTASVVDLSLAMQEVEASEFGLTLEQLEALERPGATQIAIHHLVSSIIKLLYYEYICTSDMVDESVGKIWQDEKPDHIETLNMASKQLTLIFRRNCPIIAGDILGIITHLWAFMLLKEEDLEDMDKCKETYRNHRTKAFNSPSLQRAWLILTKNVKAREHLDEYMEIRARRFSRLANNIKIMALRYMRSVGADVECVEFPEDYLDACKSVSAMGQINPVIDDIVATITYCYTNTLFDIPENVDATELVIWSHKMVDRMLTTGNAHLAHEQEED